MIKKYRTKPCEIEAVEWKDDNFDEIYQFTEGKSYMQQIFTGNYVLMIKTLEGDMMACEGDYIIKGLRGEYYPCKPDVFHKKYEEINK